MPALERTYGARIKGIGYGDSTQTVFKALGEPDATVSYQPVGLLDCVFFDEDVVIHFENFAVKTISRGVPDTLKREVEEKGKNIMRF